MLLRDCCSVITLAEMDDEKHASTFAQQDLQLNWPQSQLRQSSKLYLVTQFLSSVGRG